jgi:hypothetical protein
VVRHFEHHLECAANGGALALGVLRKVMSSRTVKCEGNSQIASIPNLPSKRRRPKGFATDFTDFTEKFVKSVARLFASD